MLSTIPPKTSEYVWRPEEFVPLYKFSPILTERLLLLVIEAEVDTAPKGSLRPDKKEMLAPMVTINTLL